VNQDLDKWQEARKVTDAKFPSFLAFLGYAFYFPGFLVGPFLEYAEYDALISEKLFSSISPPENVKEELEEARRRRAVPPGRKRVAYFKMLSGLVYLGLYVVVCPKFNYSETVEPWFLTKTIWERYELCYFTLWRG
jgi:lysophospholipid acyltransferase